MSSPDGGFAQAQGALAAAAQQTKWINQQVAAGHLSIDPEVAEKAAKHCEKYADEVLDLRRLGRFLDRVDGLGDYIVSMGLRHHFEQKAQQEGSGVFSLLESLQIEFLNQADAFRNAAKHYRSQEDQISQDLQRGVQ